MVVQVNSGQGHISSFCGMNVTSSRGGRAYLLTGFVQSYPVCATVTVPLRSMATLCRGPRSDTSALLMVRGEVTPAPGYRMKYSVAIFWLWQYDSSSPRICTGLAELAIVVRSFRFSFSPSMFLAHARRLHVVMSRERNFHPTSDLTMSLTYILVQFYPRVIYLIYLLTELSTSANDIKRLYSIASLHNVQVDRRNRGDGTVRYISPEGDVLSLTRLHPSLLRSIGKVLPSSTFCSKSPQDALRSELLPATRPPRRR